MNDVEITLKELGSKPSISEEAGLALIRKGDLVVFSPGISSGGFAEVRMALENPSRRVIATTVDRKGLEFARKNIEMLGLSSRIDTRIEDLTKEFPYENGYFDFIYARLVLHYLKASDLDQVLANFRKTLKHNGLLYVVVRSEKNIDRSRSDWRYDVETRFTTVLSRGVNGELEEVTRYLHTPQTIQEHLAKADFVTIQMKEYQEQLYKDFSRTVLADNIDHVIEVLAK